MDTALNTRTRTTASVSMSKMTGNLDGREQKVAWVQIKTPLTKPKCAGTTRMGSAAEVTTAATCTSDGRICIAFSHGWMNVWTRQRLFLSHILFRCIAAGVTLPSFYFCFHWRHELMAQPVCARALFLNATFYEPSTRASIYTMRIVR